MIIPPRLFGGIALAVALQAGAVSAEQFRAAPAPAPRVIYGGFATSRPAPTQARSLTPPAEVSYDTTGPLDRHRVYFWDDRYHRWDGSSWVVIDSADLPSAGTASTAPAPAVEASPAPAAQTQNAPAAPEDDSNLTAEVQRALAKRGYDPGPVDGEFGPQTRNAIISFQVDHGARGTGVIDSTLLQSLDVR